MQDDIPDIDLVLRHFRDPDQRWAREEVLQKPSSVPAKPGIYAWFFDNVPPTIPTDGCIRLNGSTLLYVGISPSRPQDPPSRQNLRRRIQYHYRGNAEGSTLRRTLGTLLASESGFPLRRVGSGNRITFTHEGEKWLDRWMGENAKVTWVEHPSPWMIEYAVLRALSCPLNIAGNNHHAFSLPLNVLRKVALARARELPLFSEVGQKRALVQVAGERIEE